MSEWARRNGVHYQTAWSWARNGQMPVPVIKTATGRYLVGEGALGEGGSLVAHCPCGRRIVILEPLEGLESAVET